MRVFRALLIAVFLTVSCAGGAFGTPATIVEAGSTLMYPLMNAWVAAYQRVHMGVAISTQATGSERGITQAIYGIAQIGASDAYLSDEQMRTSPMLNIALAISAQQVNYNLPGFGDAHLNLSGPVLAGIYSGRILSWDDPSIRAINASIAGRLPHEPIVPVTRADGSGDTFIFTQYLALTAPAWRDGPGFGTKVLWPPTPRGLTAAGNSGVLQMCAGTPYSIAYVGISYLAQANALHLGYAALQNRAGKFVLPQAGAIAAAARALEGRTPSDERISLIGAPGAASYPLVNYEYAIVNPHQADTSVKSELQAFLKWVLDPSGGSNAHYLSAVHFQPLSARVRMLSESQIAAIK